MNNIVITYEYLNDIYLKSLRELLDMKGVSKRDVKYITTNNNDLNQSSWIYNYWGYSYNYNSTSALEMFKLKNNNIYAVLFLASPDDFEKNYLDVEKMLKSFHVTGN